MATAESTEQVENSEGKSKKKSSSKIIYLSHVLTSWGDRMWGFAVGLYLALLFPGNLLYNAIYGLTVCMCVILGGPVIGKWVDRKSRLSATTTSIIVQNASVVICAIVLIVMLVFEDDIRRVWDGNLKIIFFCLVVLFAVIAELGSLATKIAIEKDWIVVLSEHDESKLSKMNSVMRTIDLTTSILAPAGVSQIIHFIANYGGAVFIATWNIFSGCVEIYLLHKIFKRFPDLARKPVAKSSSGLVTVSVPRRNPTSPPAIKLAEDVGADEWKTRASVVSKDGINMVFTPNGQSKGLNPEDFTEISLVTPRQGTFTGDQLISPPSSSEKSFKSPYTVHSSKEELIQPALSPCAEIKKRLQETKKGWRDYFTHRLRFAGVGLALLYMTVLGFDSITNAYMLSQGVNEALIGVLTGLGALSGILGSLSFPWLRKTLGKCSVGNFGFGFQTISLILCVVSIFLTGSPFKPEDLWLQNTLRFTRSTLATTTPTPKRDFESYTAVICFAVGLIISRFGELGCLRNQLQDDRRTRLCLLIDLTLTQIVIGLWIADLSVTQLFQEEVEERKRGVLNGVQGSLNQCFNLLKFVLVILLPHPSTFGYLTMVSWLFVLSGWISFMIFTCSTHRRRKQVKNTAKALDLTEFNSSTSPSATANT